MLRISFIFAAIIFVLSAFTIAPAQRVSALSCLPFDSLEEEQGKADAVFRGTVTKVTENADNSITYEFSVTSVWKGNVGSTVELTQQEDEVMWFYTFEDGEEYIVFAVEESGELSVPLCGLFLNITQQPQELDKVLDELGNPTSAAAQSSPVVPVLIVGAILAVAVAGIFAYSKYSSKK